MPVARRDTFLEKETMTAKPKEKEEKETYPAAKCIRGMCRPPCNVCGRGVGKIRREPKPRVKAVDEI
jgi:hypothetical protein